MILTGVRFRSSIKVYLFDPGDIALETGDFVVAETERGLTLGKVVFSPKELTPPAAEVKKIVRKATDEDMTTHGKNRDDEKTVFRSGAEQIEKHKLPMKLVATEYTLDRSKLIFYFTADGRIDFRELVKDLARIFKTRIEMRQIGVRDASKLCGGMAPCGRELCCSSFLTGFSTISIKMIRSQGLPLNPAKLSGMCGRLLCCLSYEMKNYSNGGDLSRVDKSYLRSLETSTDADALKKLDEREGK